MIRYTSASLVLTVPIELTDADIYVSLKQDGLSINVKVEKEDISINDGNTVIKVRFSQEDTARLRAYTTTYVQVNWVYQDNSRDGTLIKEIKVTDNLYSEVLEYGG